MANGSDREQRKRAAMLDAVELAVVRELGPQGVIKAHGFWSSDGVPGMWLVTKTDAEKSVVLGDERFVMSVRAGLSVAGVPFDVANRVKVAVESYETLDRDYGGSWAQLLR